jgi:hypothetical protein
MRNLLISSAIILSVSAFNATASSTTFEKTNNNFETQICYAAATKGIDGAKELVESKGLMFRTFKKSVTCNGADLTSFAKQYAKRQQQNKEAITLELVATNNDVESKICIEALTKGIEKTVAKYKVNKDYIRCNRKPLPRFVKENKQRAAAVVSISK